jgi:hypothetical protein
MYARLIAVVDEALAANADRADAADLRAKVIAVMLRYRFHRFPLLSGVSDADDNKHGSTYKLQITRPRSGIESVPANHLSPRTRQESAG